MSLGAEALASLGDDPTAGYRTATAVDAIKEALLRNLGAMWTSAKDHPSIVRPSLCARAHSLCSFCPLVMRLCSTALWRAHTHSCHGVPQEAKLRQLLTVALCDMPTEYS
jgi:hypothetical protein